MAYREFVDSTEILWRVWATYPTNGGVLSKGFEKGWLTFESSSECRRLTPIPEQWDEVSVTKLRTFLAEAQPAKKKTLAAG